MTFDINAARENLRRREEERRAKLAELAERAEEDARRIVEMLIAEFRPRRIYRWGSLLEPARFREWSDIDIAVEGLKDPLDGLRAADRASEMSGFPVDLVEMERILPVHAESIRREGRLVYEKEG